MLNIDYNSVSLQRNPKSLFESFEIKTNTGHYDIYANISTMDYYNLKTKETSWFGKKIKNKYLFVKLFCITDEVVFNFINKNNYLTVLEKRRNNYKNSILGIEDFFGDKNDILQHLHEKEEKDSFFYRFNYKLNIKIPITPFIGFVSYVYFDYKQYCLDNNVDYVTLQKSNINFTIDKFLLFKDSNINNTIERVTLQNNELWLLNYDDTTENIFFKDEDIKINLKKTVDKINIIDLDLFKKIEPSNTKIHILKNLKRKIDVMSCVGNIDTSIDDNGSLRIYVPFDTANFCSKQSNIYPFINIKKIDKKNSLGISSQTFMRDAYIRKKNIYSDSFTDLPVTAYKNLFLKSEKESISSVTILTAIDNQIKNESNTAYTYTFCFKLEDGYKKYLTEYIKEAKKHLSSFEDFINFIREKINVVDSRGRYINYNFAKNCFTPSFATEQLSNSNSLWNNSVYLISSYIELFNMLENSEISIDPLSLFQYLSPANSNIEILESFQKICSSMIKKCDFILECQNSVFLDGQLPILDKVKSYNDQLYYDYYINNDVLSFKNISDNNPAGGFMQPKRLINIKSNKLSDNFIKEDLIRDDFKISDKAESLFLSNIVNLNPNLSANAIKYQLLSKYLSLTYDFNNKSLKIKNIEEYRSYLYSLDVDTLKSFYKLLAENSYKYKNGNLDKQQIADEIINFIGSTASFMLEYFEKYSELEAHKDYKKAILFSILYGKCVKVEYLSDFEIDNNKFYKLKKPIWKQLDFSDEEFKSISSNKMQILTRLVPIDLNKLLFFSDSFNDLEIINRYAVLG